MKYKELRKLIREEIENSQLQVWTNDGYGTYSINPRKLKDWLIKNVKGKHTHKRIDEYLEDFDYYSYEQFYEDHPPTPEVEKEELESIKGDFLEFWSNIGAPRGAFYSPK